MRPTTGTRWLACLLLVTLVAGCSNDSSPDSDPPQASPSLSATADRPEVTEYFTFHAPLNWVHFDRPDNPVAYAADPTDLDDVADNVAVLRRPAYDGANEKRLTRLLKKEGLLTNVETIQVGGIDAVAARTTAKVDGAPAALRLIALNREGYLVVFTFSADRPEAEQDQLVDAVTSSWRWTE